MPWIKGNYEMPKICPKCGGKDLCIMGQIQSDEGWVSRGTRCRGCDHRWQETLEKGEATNAKKK